jgi:hypothetical protein
MYWMISSALMLEIDINVGGSRSRDRKRKAVPAHRIHSGHAQQ